MKSKSDTQNKPRDERERPIIWADGLQIDLCMYPDYVLINGRKYEKGVGRCQVKTIPSL